MFHIRRKFTQNSSRRTALSTCFRHTKHETELLVLLHSVSSDVPNCPYKFCFYCRRYNNDGNVTMMIDKGEMHFLTLRYQKSTALLATFTMLALCLLVLPLFTLIFFYAHVRSLTFSPPSPSRATFAHQMHVPMCAPSTPYHELYPFFPKFIVNSNN